MPSTAFVRIEDPSMCRKSCFESRRYGLTLRTVCADPPPGAGCSARAVEIRERRRKRRHAHPAGIWAEDYPVPVHRRNNPAWDPASNTPNIRASINIDPWVPLPNTRAGDPSVATAIQAGHSLSG
jgi:hypothetical protein